MSFLKKLLKAGERRKGPEEEKSVPDSKIEGQINIRDIQEQLTAATNFPLSELTSTGSGSQNFSIQPVSGFQGILNNINAPHTQFQFPGDFKDPQYIFVQYLYDICVGKGWLKLVDPLEP